jgi:hypothetical protein
MLQVGQIGNLRGTGSPDLLSQRCPRTCCIVKSAVKHLIGVSALAIVGSSFGLGQTAPEKWVGVWTLNTEKSTFGPILLLPGAPAGLTIVSQTIRIEQTARDLKLSGDSVMSDTSRSDHEENSLSLEGKETVIGPASFSFKRIDDATFDMVSKVNTGDINFGELSHFAFSPDGRTLTETKTQTLREESTRPRVR